ncbi:MAG: hypothetical protein P1V51_22330, partial [Deltaproteobacteria bacterium]|nr:hypothetical protein [Deltaproteobacteria bacterium]
GPPVCIRKLSTKPDQVQGACLPSLPELIADLSAPKYTYRNARGLFQLESKDAMRARGMRSPDIGDAIALTFAEPVAMPSTDPLREAIFGHRQDRAHIDFDPFAR